MQKVNGVLNRGLGSGEGTDGVLAELVRGLPSSLGCPDPGPLGARVPASPRAFRALSESRPSSVGIGRGSLVMARGLGGGAAAISVSCRLSMWVLRKILFNFIARGIPVPSPVPARHLDARTTDASSPGSSVATSDSTSTGIAAAAAAASVTPPHPAFSSSCAAATTALRGGEGVGWCGLVWCGPGRVGLTWGDGSDDARLGGDEPGAR